MSRFNTLKSVCRGLFLVAFLAGMTQSSRLAAQTETLRITPEQAAEESSQSAAGFGFSQVYFSNTDIQTMLSGERVGGIRFYTAKVDEESSDQTVIAASVYADGRETGNYLRMDGFTAVPLTPEQALNDVQRSKNSGMTIIAARFTADALNREIMQEGSDGIHVKPALGSITLVAANRVENGSQDMGTSYVKHAVPCPPDCEENILIRMD